jgi:hypothetical protein
LALTEDDVRTYGIGQSIDLSRRLGGLGAGTNTHLTKVVGEARLHEGEGCWVKRLAG